MGAGETADAHTLDNVRVVIGGENAPVRIFRVHDNRPVFTLKNPHNWYTSIPAYVVKVYGDTVVTGSMAGWVYTWSLSTGMHTRALKSDTKHRVADISLYKNILCCVHISKLNVRGNVSVWLLSEQTAQNTYDECGCVFLPVSTDLSMVQYASVLFL